MFDLSRQITRLVLLSGRSTCAGPKSDDIEELVLEIRRGILLKMFGTISAAQIATKERERERANYGIEGRLHV